MYVASNKAEKIHKALWKMHGRLEQDRQELDNLGPIGHFSNSL